MALKRQQNFLNQQRVDVPHLRAIESGVANDFDALLRGWVTYDGAPYFVRGFQLVYSIGTPAETLEVVVEDSAMFHSTATEAGTLLTVPLGTPNEVLAPANTKVSGSFAAASTNFIALDYTRAADSTTVDLVKFWSPDALREFTKSVPLSRTLDYKFVITATGFGDLLPIARVTTDPANVVTSITDCRPLLMRLGTGGTVPDPLHVYPWPDGAHVVGSGRDENPSSSSAPGSVNTPFEGGDKEFATLKDWLDAMMSIVWEMKGGDWWYSTSAASLDGLAQNQNVHILDEGVVWTWNLVTETLTWSDTVTFQIPGSTDNNTLAGGSAVLGTGQVAYVTIDRTAVAALAATVVNDEALPIHQDTFVFARRDGDDVIVGTHSFRVKPTDHTESDYSDHLAKDKILKPIITQSSADTSIWIYPSQRFAGSKRRYLYIKAKESSMFPRDGYLAGDYDGGADNDQLTEIEFVDNAGTLEVWAALPTPAPFVVGSTIMPIAGRFTPILIAISSADSITVTFGTPQTSLADAMVDSNLPVPTDVDYPVAVVILETAHPGGHILPITEDHLLDRRPTGAGGSGGAGGTGAVVEMTAGGGELLIDLSALATPISYVPGTGDLAVIENGVELYVDSGGVLRDYEETSATSITLHAAAVAGDRYKFRTGAGVTPGSTGDVTGPAAATDEAFARFDTATGKLLQNSVVLCTDTGNVSGINDLAISGDITSVVDITMTGVLIGGSSPFEINSVETDGGAAIGFVLETVNALTTDGSKILSVQNDGNEYFNIRYGDALGGYWWPAVVHSFNDNTGTTVLEIATTDRFVDILPNKDIEQLYAEFHSDPTWVTDPMIMQTSYGYGGTGLGATCPELNHYFAYTNDSEVGESLSTGNFALGGRRPAWVVWLDDTLSGEYAEIAIRTADGTPGYGRTDVRFHVLAEGYFGLSATGTLFGGNDPTTPTEWHFQSEANDGATAIGYRLDTTNALADANALLLSLQNDGAPKFEIDKDGHITLVGDIAGYLAESLLTAKGDLIVASAPATPTVLSIGATPDGFTLVTDTASPGGVKWDTAGAGNVIGPGVSTDKALPRWSGIGGTNLLNSGTTLDNDDIMTMGGAVNFHRVTNAEYAIVLANSLKATMDAHAADVAEHTAAPDNVNFPIVAPDATDEGSLLTLTTELLAAYDAHDADAELGAAWAYHAGQETADHSLVDATMATDLEDAIDKLNDLKLKYNAHDEDVVAHGTGLPSAITLANALRLTTAAHAADGSEHFAVDKHTHTELATENGTALGIITVADASAFLADDAVVVDDDGTEGPTATVYVVGITDLGGPGPYELHIQTAPGGAGIDVDLFAYLVANSADINLSGRLSPDAVSFAGVGGAAVDLASLLTLTGELLTGYAAHDADAKAATPDYHNSQYAGNDLISALVPGTLVEAVDQLNDLKSKYNSHDLDGTPHTFGSMHGEPTDDAGSGNYQEPTADASADYLTAGETIVAVIDTDSPRTVTLSSSDTAAGRIIVIKDESGGAGGNAITVDTEGVEEIDGVASVDITVNYGVLRVYSDGTNWFSM